MCNRLRRFGIGALLLVGVLSTGCSATRVAYENADTLLARYAAGELNLDRAQRERLASRLGEWFVWHRAEQAPIFHARLSALQRALADGIDRPEAVWLIATLRSAYRETVAGLNPVLTDTLLTLTDEQIQSLRESFEEANTAYREEVLAGDPMQRREQRLEWFQGQLERWIGDLNAGQLGWLEDQLARYPSTAEQWLTYRRQQQARLLTLLHQDPERAALRDFLRGWTIERRGLPDRFVRSRQRFYADLPDRLVELDRMLTPRQRHRLVTRIQSLEEIVASLIPAPEAQASSH